MTKYNFVIRDDMVATSVKFRTIRKYKNHKKANRYWRAHGWQYRTFANKIYPFVRWSKDIGGTTIWAKCVSTNLTREVWRFERRSRYTWWSSITPNWCFFNDWMEQGKLQAGYNPK